MNAVWIVIAVFLIAWVATAVHLGRKGSSKTISIGGGFLAGLCAFAIVGGLLVATKSEPLPGSLKEAGLEGKQWSGADMSLAAKISMDSYRKISFLIEDAEKRGDVSAAQDSFRFAMPLMMAWNQQPKESLGGYSNCLLAVNHLVDASNRVSKGAAADLGRFEGAATACNNAIN